jgi:uncharacterized protein YbaA (DUF1428 family)
VSPSRSRRVERAAGSRPDTDATTAARSGVRAPAYHRRPPTRPEARPSPPQQQETRMHYIDGFVLAVPSANLDQYKQMAELAGSVWMEHGALQYVEAVADDVQPGKLTSFPQAVQLKEGELVVFAFIVYRSREERDEINKKVMADPRLKDMDPKTMPFDSMRMFWGGFKGLVEL